MEDHELDDALDDLFAAPPEEFVGARDALVRTLKAAKQTEKAAEIKSWRRPGRATWALNRLRLSGDSPIPDLIAAAERVRDLQSSGQAGLREALADLRSATRRSTDAAVSGIAGARASDHGEVSAAMLAVLSDPGALALLARGRLLEVPESGLGGFGSAAGVPAPARARPTAPAKRKAPKKDQTKGGEADEAARRASSERALESARAAVTEAEAAHAEAEAEAATSRDALEDALDRVERTRAELADAQATADEAGAAADAATARVAAAARSLEDARDLVAQLDLPV